MPPLSYQALSFKGDVRFTGDLESGMWADAPWTSDFIDIEGSIRPVPAHRTRAKMRWNKDYFFVGAELVEPHIWATLTEHDSVIFQDNDFEVFIDPDGDNCEYYEYEINAFATDWDLFLPKPYRAGGSADNSWEIPGLIKRVSVYGTVNDASVVDQKWVVELGFPWSAFHGRSAPKAGGAWRVNFSRVEWDVDVVDGKYVKVAGRPEHNWVWTQQHAIDMHRPEHWGYVSFASELGKEFVDPDYDVKARLASVFYAMRDGQAVTSEVSVFRDGAKWSASLGGWQIDQDSRIVKL